VTKYDRHGYKPRERALLLTNKCLYVLDGKNFAQKHDLQLDILQEMVVTSESDNLLLLRIPLEYKKDKVWYIIKLTNYFHKIDYLLSQ